MKLRFMGKKDVITSKKPSDKKPTVRFPFTGGQIPMRSTLLERYPLNNPFAYAAIVEDEAGTSRKYFLDEVPLTLPEAGVYTRILDQLESELTIPRSEVDPKKYFAEQARRIVTKYGIKVAPIPWSKIIYFAERDLVGFGILDALLKDPNIEDISVDGIGKPIFVYHRRYESLATNVTITGDVDLDNLITRLAHMAGKHISTAFPILQGILPGRHRLMATFRREVSPYGSTLTIRKFREDPLTVVDLLNFKVLDHRMAAYIWLMMENKATVLVAGSTGSGKTTLLNALLTLTRSNTKLVTIEEVQEVNIPHFNWTALVSRESYGSSGESTSQVGLFDLVKAAMRMRPDIIVVGEVRGEEAYVLFQAISSMTGDTPVLSREDGRVTLRPIGEIVDRFYTGDAERVPIQVAGIEVLSFDNANRVSFRPVKYVLRHRADEVHRVRYTGGEVRATGSHSVFVINDDGEIVPKPVSELTTSDTLVSFCGSQIRRGAPTLDVESMLRTSDPERVVTEKLIPQCPRCDSEKVWRRGLVEGRQRYSCGVCGQVFRDDWKGLRFRDALAGKDGVRLVSFSQSLSLPTEVAVDEQLAKVLGIYMADGCVKHHRGSRVVFSFGTAEKRLFAKDVERFFARFGARPSIDDRGTYVIIEFSHTPLARLIESLCGRELNEKHVPSLMWTAPQSIVTAFLEGWRADSRRTVNGKSVSYSSARRELVNSLSWLARINERTSIITERNSKYRSAYISKPGIRPRSVALPTAPFLKLRRMLDSTAWVHSPSPRRKTISKERAIRAVQEIIAKKRTPIGWEGAKLISRITSLLDSSLVASPVLKVDREPFKGFVYDLSVPGTEAFFGGEAPVALHNTGHGGSCTLHADDVESAIQRLTSKPMDVPESFIPFLDLVFTVRRISVPQAGGGFKAVRRIVSVDEVNAVNQYFNVFRWNPASDTHAVAQLRDSPKLARLAKDLGLRLTDVTDELNRRSVVLRWLQEKGVRNYKELSLIFEDYLAHPQQIFENALRETGMSGLLEADVAQGFKL